VRAPDGISDWPSRRFRQWVGTRVESHSEQLARLEKVIAAQNKLVLDLRREVAAVSGAALARTNRPSLPDTAGRLAEMLDNGKPT